jgi:hypothetical protein
VKLSPDERERLETMIHSGKHPAQRLTIPAKPGKPRRYDYEYERNGTANLFMMFAPLGVAARRSHRS